MPTRARKTWTPISPGLGPLRTARLVADLRLTPEERVRAAEKAARASRWWNAPRRQYVISFSDLEDYFAWKRLDDLGAWQVAD